MLLPLPLRRASARANARASIRLHSERRETARVRGHGAGYTPHKLEYHLWTKKFKGCPTREGT